MAVKGKSSADRTTRWDVLYTNLKPSLADMPYIADDVNNLGEMLTHARTLETQQEDLRSQARQANLQLKEVLVEGDKVRARLGATLKGKFGFTDAGLVKYGFKPIPKVRKRKSGPAPTPTGAEGTPTVATPGTLPPVPAPNGK